jgi:hypothetical protein
MSSKNLRSNCELTFCQIVILWFKSDILTKNTYLLIVSILMGKKTVAFFLKAVLVSQLLSSQEHYLSYAVISF